MPWRQRTARPWLDHSFARTCRSSGGARLRAKRARPVACSFTVSHRSLSSSEGVAAARCLLLTVFAEEAVARAACLSNPLSRLPSYFQIGLPQTVSSALRCSAHGLSVQDFECLHQMLGDREIVLPASLSKQSPQISFQLVGGRSQDFSLLFLLNSTHSSRWKVKIWLISVWLAVPQQIGRGMRCGEMCHAVGFHYLPGRGPIIGLPAYAPPPQANDPSDGGLVIENRERLAQRRKCPNQPRRLNAVNVSCVGRRERSLPV
jgi:hypothetical protein